MKYGQFCPVAKATELLGERWTFLIVRELLMGGRRFSELQRGLGEISPALLTARLKMFEDQGLVVRRQIPAQRGFEYFPTQACEALLPIVIALGEWGLLWARQTLCEDDFDPEFLMFYLERSVDPSALPGRETIIQFRFLDLKDQCKWWVIVNGDKTQLCLVDPGRDVNVWINTTVRTMHDVWMGDRSYRSAIDTGELTIEGDPTLTRRISTWLRPSVFHDSKRSPIPEHLRAAA